MSKKKEAKKESVSTVAEDKKKEYRKNIYKFLISKEADRYRYYNFANKIIDAILY